MKKLFLLIFLTAILISCKKEKAQDHCTGYISLTNRSANPYQISLNGKAVTNVASGESKRLEGIEPGYDTVKVLQLSGYLLYPTEQSYTGNVECNGTMIVTFP